MNKRKLSADGVGKQIPGSRFFREFCGRCGTPMRVTKENVGQLNFCGDCDPGHIGVGNPSTSLNDYDSDPDAYSRADQD